MFDFIPIEFYTPIYYYVLLFVVLFTFLHTQILSIDANKTLNYNRNFGLLVLVFVLLYMGFRPIDGVFIDMTTYARQFKRVQVGDFDLENFSDPLYTAFIYIVSRLFSVHAYFFLCACLYIIPIFLACKKWFKDYWFYGFLVILSTFTFWSYGVNGIRNGIATSIFIFAISRESFKGKLLFLIVSIGFHKAMLLPFVGYFIVERFNINIKAFYIIWLVAIPLSLIAGEFWEELFTNLGFDDERLNYLVTEADENKFSGAGFRWDFLSFSMLPVIGSYYFIFVKKIEDKTYFDIVSTYLFANAFWILVIRANFSNRFAYLSWFLMGIVVIYPLLRQEFIKKQHKRIGVFLFAYFSITFILNVILNI